MSMILPMKQNDFHGCSIYAPYILLLLLLLLLLFELRIYVPSLTICWMGRTLSLEPIQHKVKSLMATSRFVSLGTSCSVAAALQAGSGWESKIIPYHPDGRPFQLLVVNLSCVLLVESISSAPVVPYVFQFVCCFKHGALPPSFLPCVLFVSTPLHCSSQSCFNWSTFNKIIQN